MLFGMKKYIWNIKKMICAIVKYKMIIWDLNWKVLFTYNQLAQHLVLSTCVQWQINGWCI